MDGWCRSWLSGEPVKHPKCNFDLRAVVRPSAPCGLLCMLIGFGEPGMEPATRITMWYIDVFAAGSPQVLSCPPSRFGGEISGNGRRVYRHCFRVRFEWVVVRSFQLENSVEPRESSWRAWCRFEVVTIILRWFYLLLPSLIVCPPPPVRIRSTRNPIFVAAYHKCVSLYYQLFFPTCQSRFVSIRSAQVLGGNLFIVSPTAGAPSCNTTRRDASDLALTVAVIFGRQRSSGIAKLVYHYSVVLVNSALVSMGGCEILVINQPRRRLTNSIHFCSSRSSAPFFCRKWKRSECCLDGETSDRPGRILFFSANSVFKRMLAAAN